MNKRRLFLLPFFLVACCTTAWAEQDFYGILMRDEDWARNLVLGKGPAGDPEDLWAGPALSHVVHGESFLKPLGEGRLDFSVTIFNDSDHPIAADYDLRDFFVYTTDGKKYPLLDTEEDSPTVIGPHSKAVFAPSLGNLRLKNNEVEMIQCSFDLGNARIFLFPWSKKDWVSKLVSPSPPPGPVEKEAPGRGPKKKTPKRNFWDWKKIKPVPPGSSRAPSAAERAAAPSARAPQPASSQSRLDSAIKNFVYVPSDGSVGPPLPSSPSVPLRDEARVVDFNKDYNFITLNLGEKDGLQNNMMLTILRDGRLVAKARVKQVREAVAAATVLPDTVRGEVRTGDKIAFA